MGLFIVIISIIAIIVIVHFLKKKFNITDYSDLSEESDFLSSRIKKNDD